MKRVIKPATVESSSWLSQAFSDRGFPEGWQVRKDYYSGKYDNVSDGVSDEDAEVQVIEDLAGTEMYLVGHGPDLIFYKPTEMMGTVRLRVAEYLLGPRLWFNREYTTSARSLLRKLENPLVIRSRQEIEKADF